MLGFWNYTVWATYASLASGVLGIFFACSGHPLSAVFCLAVSGFCDAFDGRIARMRGQDGPFGREFDSLADIVSFGIAPALLVAKAVLFQLSPPEVGWGIGILYLLCAALRLARFNCMAAGRKARAAILWGCPFRWRREPWSPPCIW